MKTSAPLKVLLPDYGALFAESIHAADFRMGERADPFHKLIYVLAGRVIYAEPRRPESEPLPPGSMLIIPHGVRHTIRDAEPSTLLLLCLSGGFLAADPDLPRLWLELARLPGRQLHVVGPARQRLEQVWRRAMLEKTHARIGGAITVRSLAAQALVLLARQPVTATGRSAAERVAAVAREVEETFYDEWNLERAAARAGLSRRRFSELFRAAAGRTFWERLNEQRLAHAARLLRAGEHSIMGVVFSCGFNDVTHFYRLFRARHGAPPRRWLAGTSGRGTQTGSGCGR